MLTGQVPFHASSAVEVLVKQLNEKPVPPRERRPDRGVIYVETRAMNQRGEPVLSFRRHVLIPKRPAGAAWGAKRW